MRVIVIACISNDGGIGYQNGIPWDSPADREFFRKITKEGNSAILMGMNTFVSMGRKPLAGRVNVVLTRKSFARVRNNDDSNDLLYDDGSLVDDDSPYMENLDGVWYSNNYDLAITNLGSGGSGGSGGNDNVFIAGGRAVYEKALMHPATTCVYLNQLPASQQLQCDRFFPLSMLRDWQVKNVFVKTDRDSENVINAQTYVEIPRKRFPSNNDLVAESYYDQFNLSSSGSLESMNEMMNVIYNHFGGEDNDRRGEVCMLYATFVFVRRNDDEMKYLELLKKLVDKTHEHQNRTNVATRSLFGQSLRFCLYDSYNDRQVLPLLTSKFVPFRIVAHELLWFLRGSTNVDYLLQNNVHIWDGNSTKEFLDKQGLVDYRPGELGPVYGHQWRNFNGNYTPERLRAPTNIHKLNHACLTERQMASYGNDDSDTEQSGNTQPVHSNLPQQNDWGYKDFVGNKGLDQIQLVIEQLMKDPFSRRHVVVAWNPEQLAQMALPPCHLMAIFNVSAGDDPDNRVVNGSNGGNYDYILNCHMTMRSADMFLGVPFNICSYALLTHMIVAVLNSSRGGRNGGRNGSRWRAGELMISMTDCHLYSNHVDAARQQLARKPFSFPWLQFDKEYTCIDDFSIDSFKVLYYKSHGTIKAPMAV